MEATMTRSEQIHLQRDEMLSNLARLIKYNTVCEDPLPGMPFGKPNADCLAEALSICEEMGFETVNMNNYCGYAQMGSGPDLIGIFGHLDIVPAGDGWNTDPFTLTITDHTAYGRGVGDDKGPLIAALYAMKLVRDSGVPLTKRIRLVFGCNEETGMQCMEYYNAHEEPVTAGFTPDGDFPGIYGEKGNCNLTAYSKKTSILSMNGGFATNAVCNRCTTEIPIGSVDVNRLKSALAETDLVQYIVTEKGDRILIEAQGVSAHASTPHLGVNAAGCTFEALQKAGMKDDFVDFYMSHIGASCDGSGIGCKIEDQYGALTFNNGTVKTENGQIVCTLDIRYPVTWTPERLTAQMQPYLEDDKGYITLDSIGQPLFYPEDSSLVQALYQAYVEITGDTQNKPVVIGGGTYAKHIPGIIAFGNKFPNTDNHIHDANEEMDLEEFEKQVLIYAQAITNFLKN